MTKERFCELLELIDRFNGKVEGAAQICHGKYEDEIHISLFYADNYINFTTYDIAPDDYRHVKNDNDLVKAEAFLRMLLASAEHCEMMRCADD